MVIPSASESASFLCDNPFFNAFRMGSKTFRFNNLIIQELCLTCSGLCTAKFLFGYLYPFNNCLKLDFFIQLNKYQLWHVSFDATS